MLRVGSDIRDAVEVTNICSKLALLCIAFPTLRLLWSRDSRFTASLFEALKQGQPEPDTAAAMALGTDADPSASAAAESSNLAAEEMLLRLPGITVFVALVFRLTSSDGGVSFSILSFASGQLLNYRKVMARVRSLADLLEMKEAAMADLLGNPQEARKLHKFVNQPAPC